MKDEVEKRIYLDYMSSTPLDIRAYEAMEPFWSKVFAHPDSLHKEGMESNKAVNMALASMESFINARSNELIFTSGGTESTAQAIRGLLDFVEESNGTLEGLHVILSKIEHQSVSGMIKFAESKKMEVTLLDVGPNGIIDSRKVRESIRPETILVSVMYVNSEVGTIQPIREISKIIKQHRREAGDRFELPNLDFKFPAFHTDASQAALYLDCDVEKLGVDMMTLDAHKIYGPKGVGALYVKNGLLLQPLFFGSLNKANLRHGTPAVPLLIGFTKAYEIAIAERVKEGERVCGLRDYFIRRIEKEIPMARLNGDREMRVPHNVSISIEEVNHEFLAVQLDELGVSVATRSACSSKNGNKSHVLEAMYEHKNPSALRISLGKETTKAELDVAVEAIKKSLNIT